MLLQFIGEMSANPWLGAVLLLVGSSVGAFFGAYLKKRGEDRAVQEGFAAIREQLRVTTRDTEEIKQQLSGRAWRSQQQWSARERYYGDLLQHLHRFRTALSDQTDYFMEPGSEHTPDSQLGEGFDRLSSEAGAAYSNLRKLVGPASPFISKAAVSSLEELFSAHWNLANFEAACTADYVGTAHGLASEAYENVLHEAKAHLGIDSDA